MRNCCYTIAPLSSALGVETKLYDRTSHRTSQGHKTNTATGCLVGLIVTNGIFLTTALHLEPHTWERGALVISAIVNVPIFLLALFILQTRFRAELQEDTYYSEYLSKKTAAVVRIDKNAAQDARIEELEQKVVRFAEVDAFPALLAAKFIEETHTETLDWSNWAVALNDLHPRFEEIRTALRSANIPLAEIFGGPRTEVPDKWIISLSHHLPAAHKALLLKVVLPFGFDGFHFWEPQREAEENEDVYIGSYGEAPYASVTTELETLLKEKVEAIDLIHYYRRHKTKFSA
jgi:hypothetical protein